MPTIKTKYLGELRTEAVHLQSGKIIITDAPTDNQGRGDAFSPTDLVAAALASCMMTIMGIAASRHEIEMEGSDMEITKIMSAEQPRRIARIEISLKITSQRPLTEAEQTLLERAAYTCPVALSLHPDIEQVVDFHWNVAQEA